MYEIALLREGDIAETTILNDIAKATILGAGGIVRNCFIKRRRYCKSYHIGIRRSCKTTILGAGKVVKSPKLGEIYIA